MPVSFTPPGMPTISPWRRWCRSLPEWWWNILSSSKGTSSLHRNMWHYSFRYVYFKRKTINLQMVQITERWLFTLVSSAAKEMGPSIQELREASTGPSRLSSSVWGTLPGAGEPLGCHGQGQSHCHLAKKNGLLHDTCKPPHPIFFKTMTTITNLSLVLLRHCPLQTKLVYSFLHQPFGEKTKLFVV